MLVFERADGAADPAVPLSVGTFAAPRLVQAAAEPSHSHKQEVFQHWPVHVREHDGIDQDSNVVVPERVKIRVQAVEDHRDKRDFGVAQIDRGEEMDEAIVDVGDEEDG